MVAAEMATVAAPRGLPGSGRGPRDGGAGPRMASTRETYGVLTERSGDLACISGVAEPGLRTGLTLPGSAAEVMTPLKGYSCLSPAAELWLLPEASEARDVGDPAAVKEEELDMKFL